MKIKGFTLIEVAIVIVILGIVATIGSSVLHESFQAGYASRDFINASWQTRLALTRLTSELREIRSATSSDLDISSNNQITFTDIYGDSITYTRSGNDLTRNGTKVANDITDLTFTYYDEDNVEVTNPANVADVRCIDIATQVTEGSTTVDTQTIVCPRNTL